MKVGDLVFVYGTLRRGESSSLSESPRFANLATFVGESRINGDIYKLGWFPGVKLPEEQEPFDADKPTVVGEVFKIDALILPNMLDTYEGYPHLYGKKEVYTEHDHVAWVYTYNGGVEPETRIATGDWKNEKG